MGVDDAAQVLRARRVREHERAEALEPEPQCERQHHRRELLAGILADDGRSEDPVRSACCQHLRIAVGRVVGEAANEHVEFLPIPLEGAFGSYKADDTIFYMWYLWT